MVAADAQVGEAAVVAAPLAVERERVQPTWLPPSNPIVTAPVGTPALPVTVTVTATGTPNCDGFAVLVVMAVTLT